MDAVAKINQHLDVMKLLEHYDFKGITIRDNHIRACCKIHDGDNPTSFVASAETGLWYCHAGCGGGDVYTLVQHLEGCGFTEAVKIVASLFCVDIGNLEIVKQQDALEKELKKWLGIMKRRKTPLNYEHYTIQATVSSIRRLRDFQSDTIKYFQVGHTDEIMLFKKDGSSYPLYNRLVFPIYFDNILVGVNLRRVKGTDEPKWSLQPRDFQYGDILYNYDNAKSAKEIVVCEGIYDVFAYHEINVPAVACFGAHMSDEQYKLLIKTGADITLSYDGDDAGERATQNAIKLLKNKVTLRQVTLPPGHDPADISREELRSYFNERRKIR